jgi:hypothetical protein
MRSPDAVFDVSAYQEAPPHFAGCAFAFAAAPAVAGNAMDAARAAADSVRRYLDAILTLLLKSRLRGPDNPVPLHKHNIAAVATLEVFL